jgi:hypothetical protein
MIKTVKQACRFNPIIRDYRMSQGIENLADLINDAGDGSEFFSRNFVTHGMDQLFREGLLRLSGKSDQAVFELTQAMGGGKTHMMIALGLLARHPNLRKDVLSADLTRASNSVMHASPHSTAATTPTTSSGAKSPPSSGLQKPSSRIGRTGRRRSISASGRKSSATSRP